MPDYRLSMVKERIEFAGLHGDQAALAHYGIKEDTLRRYRAYLEQAEKTEEQDEYRIIFDKTAPKKWDDYPHLYGDWLIVNDLHLPFINMEMLDKALKASSLLDLKQLVILGDLVDFESVSKFDFGGTLS